MVLKKLNYYQNLLIFLYLCDKISGEGQVWVPAGADAAE